MAIMNNIKTTLSELKAEAIAIIRNFINTSTPSHQYTWILVGGKRLIFEKSPVDPDGEIKVWHDLKEGEKGVLERDYVNLSVEEWVEAASKLQKKVIAFGKVKREPQVITQAEAEIRKFCKIYQDAHHNLKEAEEKFNRYWNRYGVDSLEQD